MFNGYENESNKYPNGLAVNPARVFRYIKRRLK